MRVGRAFGRLPHELRDVPLHWLVWDYLSLRDEMRVDDIIAERDRIRSGYLTALAFHEPKRLADEERTLNASARAFERGESDISSRERLMEFARRMQSDINAKGVFADAPPSVVS